MGGMWVRIETNIVTATIGPGNFSAEFDSDVGWLEVVCGGSDGVLVDGLDGSGGGRGGTVRSSATLCEVEVIDGGINDATNH